MPLVIPDDFAHAQYFLRHTGVTKTAVVTCGHVWDSGSKDPQTLADQLRDRFDDFLPRFEDSVIFERVLVLCRDSGGTLFSAESVDGGVGTNGGFDIPPPQVALLVKKITGVAGPAFRGRMFVPFALSEASVTDNGVVAAATITAWNTALSSWLANLVTDDNRAMLLHQESDEVPSPPAPTIITSMVASTLVATQRRRLARAV